MVSVLFISTLPLTVIAEELNPTVNINIPTADKNWATNYKPTYTPASTRPNTAPATVGIRSMSANSYYDYKQTTSSLRSQASSLYLDSFKEIFSPGDQRYLNDIFGTVSSDRLRATNTNTGNAMLDSFKSKPYIGLSEEEVKWLINNNIVSRDTEYIKVITTRDGDTEDSEMDISPYPNLIKTGGNDPMEKSDFLMALHKATYGVIESRPIVLDLAPYRHSQKVTWVLEKDTYTMKIDEVKYNNVLQRIALEQSKKNEEARLERKAQAEAAGKDFTEPKIEDRGEYITRLEGDTNYIVSTFPEKDKLFIVNPNVTELYIKSLIDKGILDTKSLMDEKSPTKTESKNKLESIIRPALQKEFEFYGRITDTKKQMYPAYAPELGPFSINEDNWDGKSHTYFEPEIINSDGSKDFELKYVWGNKYKVNVDTSESRDEISITCVLENNEETGKKKQRFFETEQIMTIDALRFIEAILRVREGDMTDTEAKIVSYKYGVTFIDTLYGSDRSTVMYLTAKGILNFEKFDEYTFLYEPLEKIFAYTLLYRVANPAARKNMKEIQLTDSDQFWMNKGFGSYEKTMRVPNISSAQSYMNLDGYLVVNPQFREPTGDSTPNNLGLIPYTETVSVEDITKATVQQNALARVYDILGEGLKGNMTTDLSNEYFSLVKVLEDLGTIDGDGISDDALNGFLNQVTYLADGIPVYHAKDVDIYANSGVDLYNGVDFLTKDNSVQSFSSFATIVSGKSPFGVSDVKAVDDTKESLYKITKLFDDPYKYLFDKSPIMEGIIPARREDRIPAGASKSTTKHDISDKLCKKGSNVVKKAYYYSDLDKYEVVFEIEAMTPMAALQLVDSKLEVAIDTLTEEQPVNVASKITLDGKEVILVAQSSLPVIDPDLVALDSKTLLNRRTGAKAFILTEQNVALVGNNVVSAPEGSLMVEATDNDFYYNLEIISSLLSSSALSTINTKDFYNCIDIHTETERNVLSPRGEDIGQALTGEYESIVSLPKGDISSKEVIDNASGEKRLMYYYIDADGKEQEIKVDSNSGTMEITREYINLSQLTTGSNLITKDFVEKTSLGFDLKYTVIVEWTLSLPNDQAIKTYLNDLKIDPSINPSISEINKFYYTRPDGDNLKQLADYWDSNIYISNAIANVMFETTGYNYVNCGYLVPEISLLFEFTEGAAKTDLMTDDYMQAIVGKWFQKVGQQIDKIWVNKFFGSDIYNRIVITDETKKDSPDYYANLQDDILLYLPVYKDSNGAGGSTKELAYYGIYEVDEYQNATEASNPELFNNGKKVEPSKYLNKKNNIKSPVLEETYSYYFYVESIDSSGNPSQTIVNSVSGSSLQLGSNSIQVNATGNASVQLNLVDGRVLSTKEIIADSVLNNASGGSSQVTLELTDGTTVTLKSGANSSKKKTGETKWIGGIYYNDKPLNFNWFPAWVHAAFNNPHPKEIGRGSDLVYYDVFWGDFDESKQDYVNVVYPKNGKLWREMDSIRTFGYYPRKERRSFGTVYGNSGVEDITWVKLPSGAVYKSLGGKSNYELSGNSVIADTRKSAISYGYNLRDYSKLVGDIVTYKAMNDKNELITYQFYVSRLDAQYLELIAVDPIEGRFKNGVPMIGDERIEVEGNGILTKLFIGDPKHMEYEDKKLSTDNYRDASNQLKDELYAGNKLYWVTGADGKGQVERRTISSKGGKITASTDVIDPGSYDGETVLYNPIVRLSLFSWDVIPPSSGEAHASLHYRKVIPAMLFSGLYQSALTRTMVDTMVSKSVGYIPLEDVPIGSTILFGDTLVYKDYIGYVTAPILAKYSSELPVIEADTTVKQGNIVATALRTFNITLDSGGTIQTVADFINKVSLAPRLQTDLFVYNNTLVAENLNNPDTASLAKNDGSFGSIETTVPLSISYLIDFSPGLKVLPLSSDAKSYILLFSTSADGVGALSQMPVFATDSERFISGRIPLAAFSSNFRPLPNQKEVKAEFMTEVTTQAVRDVKYWISMILSYTLAYLMVMLVLVFFAMQITTVQVLVTKIKHPANNQRGPDIIQIITFGIMNVDQGITGGRLVVSIFLLATIFAVLTLI